MTKMSGALYPRGFFIPDSSGMVVMDQGHRDIDRLIDYLFSGKVNTQGFSYYKEVFPVAMHMFNDFAGFLQAQKINPFLYGYNYEFLLDTLKFIQTGSRKVSIHNWKPLMAEWTEPHTDLKHRMTTGPLVEFQKYLGRDNSTVQVIAQWCSHPQGFEDMVMTMWLMFGSSFEKDEHESKADRIKKFHKLFA